MARRIFDFRCPNGHLHDSLVDVDVHTDPCPQCGLVANRIISPVRSKLDPISGDFPGATLKWARMHEKAGGYTPDES